MSSFLYKRGEVYLIQEHPGIGNEIKKTRPWLILGVDPLNRARSTIIAAPCSTQAKPIPRLSISILLNNTQICILLDQLRAMDKSRFISLEHHTKWNKLRKDCAGFYFCNSGIILDN